VGLQRNVDSDVGCDMITLDGRCTALVPTAREVEVVRALSSDVLLADVLL
jgi:hypothetical protein